MDKTKLFQIIDEKKVEKEEIASWLIDDNNLVDFVFDGLNHKKGNIKFGCDKILRIISEISPALIYPYFERFLESFRGDNKFLKLGSILVLGNLTAVDKDNKFDIIQDEYFEILKGGDLMATGTVIKTLPIILQHIPNLYDTTLKFLLNIPEVEFDTAECQNIAIGHTLDAFEKILKIDTVTPEIKEFIVSQANNTRQSVQTRALKLMTKFDISLEENL